MSYRKSSRRATAASAREMRPESSYRRSTLAVSARTYSGAASGPSASVARTHLLSCLVSTSVATSTDTSTTMLTLGPREGYARFQTQERRSGTLPSAFQYPSSTGLCWVESLSAPARGARTLPRSGCVGQRAWRACREFLRERPLWLSALTYPHYAINYGVLPSLSLSVDGATGPLYTSSYGKRRKPTPQGDFGCI